MPWDRIEADGSPLGKTPAIHLVMNKPRGVVTSASDEQGRATVYDLLEPGLPWVGPVGRLDKASEGLLLLTNDSEWAAKITEPSSHLDKKYHVQVDRVADADLLAKIDRGFAVEGNVRERAAAANICAPREHDCFGTAIRIAGSRLRSTKARTGKSGVCSKRWRFESCVW